MAFRFSYRRYCLRFRAPVRTAHGWWAERDGLIVRATDDENGIGFGEAAPIPWFGTETIEAAEGALRKLNGEISSMETLAVLGETPCARHALACALEAATAQSALRRETMPPTAPLTAYLPVAALLPAGKPALEKLRSTAEAGFRTFKWKVGVADIQDELSLLDDLIANLPTGGRLRLDANGAWQRTQAERWLERAAERPIEFVEQPIAPDVRSADDLLLGLAADFPTPLALDEAVATNEDVTRWLDLGWPGVFVVKPLLLGDAAAALEALRARGAPVVFSSALETAVGARHALTLAFRHGGESRALGFGVWPLFEDARFDGPQSAPFIRREDLEHLDPEAVWNALS